VTSREREQESKSERKRKSVNEALTD